MKIAKIYNNNIIAAIDEHETVLFTSFLPKDTTFYNIIVFIQSGAWTAFRQMPFLFVIGLPISPAKKAQGHAALESFLIFMVFTYFVGSLLTLFPIFGVDMSQEVGGTSGLAMVAGVKTLDTNIVGALLITSISVYLHNKFYDKKLPAMLGVFQGTNYVVMIGFLLMIPVAVLTCIVWPTIQHGILQLQNMFLSSGLFGVFTYTFLEKLLIPTGLHHFIYQPFMYGPAVVDGGIAAYWAQHLPEYMNNTQSLREMFPAGAFSLHGMTKLFAPLGISAALYTTAKTERKKKVLSILIPVSLTAMVAGVTEPFEFTFLFVAPLLFVVHAILGALMSTIVYALGVSGQFGGAIISFVTLNWLPLGKYHWQSYLIQIAVGLSFSFIYFIVFRWLILKFNFKTPGREDEEEIKLYSKKDYKEKKKTDSYEDSATVYAELLGGKENIESITNCASRLRVRLKDIEVVAQDGDFLENGAFGVVRQNDNIQVIIGTDVPHIREAIEKL